MKEEKIITVLRNLLNQQDKWGYEEESKGKNYKEILTANSKDDDYECRIVYSTNGVNSARAIQLWEAPITDEDKIMIMEKNLETYPFYLLKDDISKLVTSLHEKKKRKSEEIDIENLINILSNF